MPVGDALLRPGEAVVTQLLASDGGCWESTYDPAPIANRGYLFKDKCGRGHQGGC